MATKSAVSINVALYPGQTVTVCRTIDYKSKTVNFKLTNGNNDKRKYDKYKLSGYDGDTGQSSACAEITRPSEPEGYVDSTGTADSTIMFAGEDADISWDTYAESMPTRRLSGWQAVAYRTPVRYEYDNIDTFGNLWNTNRYRGAGACSYLRNKMHWDSCDIIGDRSGTLNFGASDGNFPYNEEEDDVVVPDTVGAKYCNTFKLTSMNTGTPTTMAKMSIGLRSLALIIGISSTLLAAPSPKTLY